MTPPQVADDWIDLNGQYGDVAILQLDSAAPASQLSISTVRVPQTSGASSPLA